MQSLSFSVFFLSYTSTYEILYTDDAVPDSMAYDGINPKFDGTLKEALQLILAGKEIKTGSLSNKA